MNRTLSIYLDLLRFVAACAVFMAHVPMFVGGYLWQLGQWGHQAVVIFFVLSGFVIAFVTDGKERTLTDYAINRASRIYSVAIPALIISIIVFYWALAIKPEVLSAFSHKMLDPFATLLAALTFTNQSWINFSVFANPPYWSLGYEVMYYIFFGVVFYLKGWTRIVLATITAIAMGPSIVLYAPLWFIGVLTYHKCKNRRASESSGQSLIIFLFTLAAIAFLMLPATVKYINNIAVAAFPETFFDWLISPAQKFWRITFLQWQLHSIFTF